MAFSRKEIAASYAVDLEGASSVARYVQHEAPSRSTREAQPAAMPQPALDTATERYLEILKEDVAGMDRLHWEIGRAQKTKERLEKFQTTALPAGRAKERCPAAADSKRGNEFVAPKAPDERRCRRWGAK